MPNALDYLLAIGGGLGEGYLGAKRARKQSEVEAEELGIKKRAVGADERRAAATEEEAKANRAFREQQLELLLRKPENPDLLEFEGKTIHKSLLPLLQSREEMTFKKSNPDLFKSAGESPQAMKMKFITDLLGPAPLGKDPQAHFRRGIKQAQELLPEIFGEAPNIVEEFKASIANDPNWSNREDALGARNQMKAVIQSRAPEDWATLDPIITEYISRLPGKRDFDVPGPPSGMMDTRPRTSPLQFLFD